MVVGRTLMAALLTAAHQKCLPIPVMAASPAVVAQVVPSEMFAVTFLPVVSGTTALSPD